MNVYRRPTTTDSIIPKDCCLPLKQKKTFKDRAEERQPFCQPEENKHGGGVNDLFRKLRRMSTNPHPCPIINIINM
jgi:hypothetical protein